MVGGAGRELAGRRQDAGLQRRVRCRRRARLAGAGGLAALLGGIVLAAVVVCAYALLTKVLPNELSVNPEANFYARLQDRMAIGTRSA